MIGYAVVEVFPGGSPGGGSGGGVPHLGSLDFDVLTRTFRNPAAAGHDDLFDLFG